MPSVRVVIPLNDLPAYPPDSERSLSNAAKFALKALLENSEGAPEPQLPPASWASQSVVIWISDEQAASLDLICRRFQALVSRGDAATAILHAGARAHLAARGEASEEKEPARQPRAKSPLDLVNDELGQHTSPDQGRFYDGVRAFLASAERRHVLFAEASTGTGKTRAFLAAAIEWCHRNGKPVVVAVPSFAVLDQAAREARRLAAHEPTKATVEVVVGMGEFVSLARLNDWVWSHNELPCSDEVRAWIEKGGPPAANQVIDRPWTVAGLIAHAPSFAFIEDVRLTGDDDHEDEGKQSYLKQFADGLAADMVLCTHAMLASDVAIAQSVARAKTRLERGHKVFSNTASEFFAEDKSTRGFLHERVNDLIGQYVDLDRRRLPPEALIVVDEGHLLEQNFSATFGYGISLWRLASDMRRLRASWPKAVKLDHVEAVNDAWQMLRNVGIAGGAETSPLSEPQIQEPLARLRAVLVRVSSAKAEEMRRLPEFRRVREAAACLSLVQASSGRSSMFGLVAWSPTRNYPRLLFGRSDVSAELDFLWTNMAELGVVVSATLYERTPQLSVEAVRKQLGVRVEKVSTMEPVAPSWIYEPVTLILPAKRFVAAANGQDNWLRFTRPTVRESLTDERRNEKYELWLRDVGSHISEAYRNGAGGMLVLGTAYRDIEGIREYVLKTGAVKDPRCLLIQKESVPLLTLRRRFLDLSMIGLRPMLLGVGAAWTGLDLSPDFAVPAEQDNVLTDLVILNAPIGTNRSITQMRRRSYMGPVADFAPAQITFRQGIGRLVRRPGLPRNRRLHFLDGRINDPAWAMYMARLMRTLVNYSKRIEC